VGFWFSSVALALAAVVALTMIRAPKTLATAADVTTDVVAGGEPALAGVVA
jgi:hypothetical protein